MVWNVALPQDTETVNQGGFRFRELKSDLATAFAAEHMFPGPNATNPVLYYTPLTGTFANIPAAAKTGRLYVATDTGIVYEDSATAVTPTWTPIASLLPTGSIIQYGASPAQAPAGFLLCNGAAVSRTGYAALFAIIGTGYGVGDGSTTFNLPNLSAIAPTSYLIKI